MKDLRLRGYQTHIVNQIKDSKERRILVQLPTGAGKSIIMKYLANHAPDSHLILTHRYEIKDIFKNYNVKMVESYKHDDQFYKVVLVDEAHISNFDKVLDRMDSSQLIIGFSATPIRTGRQRPLSTVYQKIIKGLSTSDLIESKNLVPTQNYSFFKFQNYKIKKTGGDFDLNQQSILFQKNKIYQGVYENYIRICPNSKALLFAPNLKATFLIYEFLKSKNLPVGYIDSKMSKKDRKAVVDWFIKSKNGILCNCSILTTGFDCPDIQTIILYRATTSLALYNQMIGRATRPAPDKEKAIVLDFGENIQRHDFWEADRDWSLEPPKKSRKTQGFAPVKLCPECFKILKLTTEKCDKCGYIFPPKPQPKPEKVELKLIKQIKPKIGWRLRQVYTVKEALEIITKEYGYKKGWWYVNKSRYPHIK